MILETTLAKFLEAWQDGGLTEVEEAELLLQLDNDPELRRRFAGQVAILGAVRAAAEQNPRWLALFDLLAAEDTGTKHLSFEAATMKQITRTRSWYKLPTTWALAAALILLLAGSFFFKPRWINEPEKITVIPTPKPLAAVAVVVAASPDAGQTAGTYLKPGLISQASGWLTFQTLSGVAVTLDAPFRAELLNHDRIFLGEGRARVRVPAGAEGFRLDSPAFDIVDLGTEFAANVSADGRGTCRVFEGKADVSLLDSIGEVKVTQRLTANESVRVIPSEQEIQVITEVGSDYPEMKQPPRPLLALPHSYPSEVMALGPLGYWRFEEILKNEVADEVTGGARLQAAGTAKIAKESGGNHSGELIQQKKMEYFQIPDPVSPMLGGDFSISLFAQFEWLQNFVLISAMRYDSRVQGHSLVLQSYASFRRSGLNGSGLHAVLYDPPAWDGGVEIYGNTLLRPLYWHHIAAIRKGDRLTLFLDGVVVGSEFVGTMALDHRQIFVGRLNGNASQSRQEARGLVGHIDELAIFPRALTNAEIQRLSVTKK